jgi:hypothetical protein
MALPSSVAVNPQSQTDATSGATSGGALTFAFGGNPNLAFVPTAAASSTAKWLKIAAAVVTVAVVGRLLWKLAKR